MQGIEEFPKRQSRATRGCQANWHSHNKRCQPGKHAQPTAIPHNLSTLGGSNTGCQAKKCLRHSRSQTLDKNILDGLYAEVPKGYHTTLVACTLVQPKDPKKTNPHNLTLPGLNTAATSASHGLALHLLVATSHNAKGINPTQQGHAPYPTDYNSTLNAGKLLTSQGCPISTRSCPPKALTSSQHASHALEGHRSNPDKPWSYVHHRQP